MRRANVDTMWTHRPITLTQQCLLLPSHGRGHWFDPSSAPDRNPLCFRGFRFVLWEVDDAVILESRQKVGTRRVRGRVEGVCDVAIESFEEMSVDIEHRPYRGVTEPGCDHLWVGSLFDE